MNKPQQRAGEEDGAFLLRLEKYKNYRKVFDKKYKQTNKYKEYINSDKYKENKKIYEKYRHQTPEYKESERIRDRERRKNDDFKKQKKEYRKALKKYQKLMKCIGCYGTSLKNKQENDSTQRELIAAFGL